MTISRRFAINARFLTRPASGVDRVAIELIKALAARPDVDQLILLHPPADTLHTTWLDSMSGDAKAKTVLQEIGNRHGHLWEQTTLVRALPDLMLLSLCSTGPVLRRKQAVMIHDAQVWDAKSSFSRAFRLAYRVLLPLVARTSQHVLTVSNFAKGRLEALGIAPRGKPKVILNGADHMLLVSADSATLDRFGLAKNGYILAIGNLAPHKNLVLLTNAAANRAPGAPELIVAGGMNAKVFANAGLRPTNGVRFIGRVTDAELKELYHGAIALAFPSLTEGFGLPPVEAMMCGCPVVATTGGAVPEICGNAALFVDPTDTAGWSAALEQIATDTVLRQDLRAKGLMRGAKYTWAAAAQTLMEVVK